MASFLKILLVETVDVKDAAFDAYWFESENVALIEKVPNFNFVVVKIESDLLLTGTVLCVFLGRMGFFLLSRWAMRKCAFSKIWVINRASASSSEGDNFCSLILFGNANYWKK